MENMDFTSMEQIDDISTIDEYKVALNAGRTEKEALQAASAFPEIMQEPRCSGIRKKMPVLQQEHPGLK